MEEAGLAKVSTQQAFMDELERLHVDEEGDSVAGRPRDLKTYIVEVDEPLQASYQTDGLDLRIDDTGLDHIKILTAKDRSRSVQYYMDKTDERFIVLHTGALATDSDIIAAKMVGSDMCRFDSAWLHTGMLKFIGTHFGNKPIGYAVRYKDIFKDIDSVAEPKNDLKMEIIGAISDTVLDTIKKNSDIDQIMGYERVLLSRGTGVDAIMEDLQYNGRFRLAKGDSIDEHTNLIQCVVGKYRDTIQAIEQERIVGKEVAGGFTIEGNAFTFEFKRAINEWGVLLRRIFNAQTPFRIWGLPVADTDMQKILCVDMHAGDQLDVEVSEDMMRVYLPDGACGNVILRLYTNLQRYVDANVTCAQLEE